MKVGDYVRTDDGCICKVLQYTEISDTDFYVNTDSPYNVIYKSWIVKSSPNIIELLEEHDFITIEYYSLRYNERVTRIFEVDYKDEEFTTLKNAYCDFMLKNNEFNDNDKALEPIIKSIVTHEQFSQNEYRIGE